MRGNKFLNIFVIFILGIIIMPINVFAYTLSFDSNGGSGTMDDINDISSFWWTNVSNNFTAPEGKIFAGWSLSNDNNTKNFVYSLTLNKDEKLYAIWKTPISEASATITEPVGGSLPDIHPVSGNSLMYSTGGVAHLTDAEWSTNFNYFTKFDNNNSFTAGSKYTVHIGFRPADGYCFTENTVFKINGNVAENYATTGGSVYIRGAKYEFTASDASSVKYKISFNSNGGSGTMNDVTNLSGTYILPENQFTAPNGKQFKGWSLTNNGEVITTLTMDSNKTIYAIWEDIPVSYTYKYLSGDNQEFIKGKIDNYTYKIDGDYNKFEFLKIGDLSFEKNIDYIVVEGSTIVTFTGNGITKLNTLESGTYNVNTKFSDNLVSGKLIIKEEVVQKINNSIIENPNTGDNIIINIIIGFLSLIGLVSLGVINKLNKFN